MGNQWVILPVPALVVFFLLTLSPGCLTSSPDVNLTEGELADHYLAQADTIRDYRSEYIDSEGTAVNPYVA